MLGSVSVDAVLPLPKSHLNFCFPSYVRSHNDFYSNVQFLVIDTSSIATLISGFCIKTSPLNITCDDWLGLFIFICAYKQRLDKLPVCDQSMEFCGDKTKFHFIPCGNTCWKY